MKDIISKELLSEVLKLDFIPKYIETELGYIRYCASNKINICELAHNLLDEWAKKEGFLIRVWPDEASYWHGEIMSIYSTGSGWKEVTTSPIKSKEMTAIALGQWLLDNRVKK